MGRLGVVGRVYSRDLDGHRTAMIFTFMHGRITSVTLLACFLAVTIGNVHRFGQGPLSTAHLAQYVQEPGPLLI